MTDFFISYRRQDSAGHAARLHRDLVARYGDEQVFFDVDVLALGQDFAKQIHRNLSSAKAVLVVIGPEWTTATNPSGQRRLDDPSDSIRTEIAAALRSGKPLIPIFVGGARMPHPDALPADLRPLTRVNGVELDDRRWEQDILRLYEFLDDRSGLVHAPATRRLSLAARLRIALSVLAGREPQAAAPSVASKRQSGERPSHARAEAAEFAEPRHADASAPHKHVFVSYADEDRPLADQVVKCLEDRGHTCWVSYRDIPPGTGSWAGPIVAAIANSALVVVIVTEFSVASKQVLREVTVADDENIPLMPACLEDISLSGDLRYFFASSQRLELAKMTREQTAHTIGTAVERHLASA